MKSRNPPSPSNPGRDAAASSTASRNSSAPSGSARPRPAFLALAAGLFAVPWIVGAAGRWKETMTEPKWPAVWLAMFGFLALAAWTERRREKFPLAAPEKLWFAGAAAILAGLALSALVSPVPGLGLMVSLREGFFVLFALGVAVCRPTRHERALIIHAALLAMALQAALTLGQLLLSSLAPAGLRGRRAMLGTIGNPEYLASWLAAGLAMCAVWWREILLRHGWAPRRVAAPLAATGLMLAVLFLSGGRGAALSALGALGAAWVVLKLRAIFGGAATRDAPPPHLRSPLIGIGVALLLAAVIGGLWMSIGPQRRGSLPARMADMADLQSGSMRHRVGMMTVTAHMIGDRPLLGCGPGRYGAAFGETLAALASGESGAGWWTLADVLSVRMVVEAHSDWMQWWAEYGLLPALGLTLMLGVALGQGWRARGDWTTGALTLALLVFALSMWVSFPLHTPTRALYFWALLGLLAGSVPTVSPNKK